MRYRLGVGALLKQLSRPVGSNRASQKRNLAEATQSSTATEEEMTTEPEVSRKIARLQISNVKEVFREREIFASKALAYGFTVADACNNYLKSCKWSSSGNLLATTSQDREARIFRFFDKENFKLELQSSIGLGDLIYDSCWHPSQDWLATSSKDHPIHLWDANGQRLATFRGINNLDELASAHSLCFASDGSILYAGYSSVIKKFDINRPGQQICDLATWSKESRGQKGIISCIAINPVLSTNYAVGSYGGTVGFYSSYSPSVECLFECQLPGVTWIQYSPDGNFLLTAGRKDDDITCWDLRLPGKIYALYRRPSATNQRLYFDIDSSGSYLFSGSSTGELYVFDLKCTAGDGESTSPCTVISAHRSALCGVSIHREKAVAATCSGQRVFPFPELDYVEEESGIAGGCSYEDTNSPELLDNSLALWSFQQ